VLYLAAFAAALLVDTIPVFAPPARIILAFMIINWKLNPWGIIATGALGSVIGRYILTLYMPHVSAKTSRSAVTSAVGLLVILRSSPRVRACHPHARFQGAAQLIPGRIP
jgi:hypothetical protein